MTSSSLDLVWPPSCKQCSGNVETSKRIQDYGCEPPQPSEAHDVRQRRLPESQDQCESRAAYYAAPESSIRPQTHPGQMKPFHPADFWPRGPREQAPLYEREHILNYSRGFAGPSNWPQDCSMEEAEHLEAPLPLMSDINYTYYVPSKYTAARLPVQRKCLIINMTSGASVRIEGSVYFYSILFYFIPFYSPVPKECSYSITDY